MVDFYIATSGNLNSLDGGAKFCRTLCANTDYWAKHGINISSFSNSEIFQNPQNYVRSLRHKIKQFIKKALDFTEVGKSIAFFNYNINMIGLSAFNKLPESINASAWILINDVNVAFHFYKKYKNKYNTIFMMHNSGDLLSMMKPMMTSKKIKNFLLQLEKDIYANATKIVFVSKHAYETFINSHPQYQEKCCYIYNGIDDLGLDAPEEDRDYSKLRLVTIGTVGERKNQIALIKAIDELGDQNIELTVVGNGPKYQECCDYVKSHHLENQIKMVGAQSNVKPFLQDANAFIMTSLDEGLPISATEALSASLPIIITDVGGCRDVIQDNGLLIKPDLDDIKRGIKYFADNLQKLKDWGEQSREIYLENFTISKMLSEYLGIVKSEFQTL